MIKIAFFDVDGTLIDFEKSPSVETLTMLKKLKENNIKIIIATGRPFRVVPKFEGVEFDGYLTFNGGYCFSKDTVIYKNPIKHESVLKVIENGERINRPVLLMCMDSNGANGSDKDMIDYMRISKQGVEIPYDFETYCKQDVYQIIAGATKEEEKELVKDIDDVKMTTWWPRAGDIIPKDGGKGIAVTKMLEYFNCKKEEAIAFGDGNNDIEMFLAVGMAVAMENATEDLKKVATDICGHVKDEGVSKYCKKIGLI